MKARTRARGVALQALYEIDIANHPVGQVLDNRLEDETLSDELMEFTRQIVCPRMAA
jgi:N utilization substance protein B